ncbi:MAG: RNA 2'-phosphotransferase, partial [Myxococcota bacterium]
ALDRAVEYNNKSRFQVREGLIRASQGHSLETMPVTREALEASWSLYHGDGVVWHGTHPEALEGIAQSHVIHSGSRTHVHLAATLHNKVGKRAGVHVMLGADVTKLRAHGLEVFESPNGVVLVRQVPLSCITALETMTRRAKRDEIRLRTLAGLG